MAGAGDDGGGGGGGVEDAGFGQDDLEKALAGPREYLVQTRKGVKRIVAEEHEGDLAVSATGAEGRAARRKERKRLRREQRQKMRAQVLDAGGRGRRSKRAKMRKRAAGADGEGGGEGAAGAGAGAGEGEEEDAEDAEDADPDQYVLSGVPPALAELRHAVREELPERRALQRHNFFDKAQTKAFASAALGGAKVGDQTAIVLRAVAKLLVRDVTEVARLVRDERGDSGPLRPLHVTEAQQRLLEAGRWFVPSVRRVLFQR
jgi:hypothetical protein